MGFLLFSFQLLLQPYDLVAILRSLEEVEILRRLLHQFGGVGDTLLKLLARHALHNGVGSESRRLRLDLRAIRR